MISATKLAVSLLALTFQGAATTSHHLNRHQAHQMFARDAYTDVAPVINEGENHTYPIVPPPGANYISFPVSAATGADEELPMYWSQNPQNATATQAFVMIHGKLRNGWDYWSIMNDALQSAVKANYPNADPNAIVTAPQFYSEKYNSGQFTAKQLAFGDTNQWESGATAIHPSGTSVTVFDAMDALIYEFSDKTKYPKMERLIFVGHGGGGQLNSRYAIVGKDAPANSTMAIRWIVGDPSSNPYFTLDRPMYITSLANKTDCPLYNTWRYGYDNFTGTAQGLKTPQEYFAQTITRDVRWIVGYQDTTSGGDQECMALLQGGVPRRDRNLCWWRYLNTLARTSEDLTGFPGTFTSPLPDYSNISHNVIAHRLTVVEQADHDAAVVFGSAEGRSVLFDNSDNVLLGWRPQGWVNNATNATQTSSNGTPIATTQDASSSTKSTSGAAAMMKEAQAHLPLIAGVFFTILAASTMLVAA
ncbi:hypothetical protein BZG36_05452 [Bifiguratus adelaidae]|uniref:AB hydrolase-1 domain-containing protein n=1 Tax=Bifiguratus adelaidae TaxID=1938954 RepID=A0A261XTS6_9FUNG|nr:hypothetical protein BZG36_05452 [Bifiguratus adelaidae]